MTPYQKSRALMEQIIPASAIHKTSPRNFHIQVKGKYDYTIRPYSRTKISKDGVLKFMACFAIPPEQTKKAYILYDWDAWNYDHYPNPDRMIAEYLMIRSDELLYWKIANVWPCNGRGVVKARAFYVDEVQDYL